MLERCQVCGGQLRSASQRGGKSSRRICVTCGAHHVSGKLTLIPDIPPPPIKGTTAFFETDNPKNFKMGA